MVENTKIKELIDSEKVCDYDFEFNTTRRLESGECDEHCIQLPIIKRIKECVEEVCPDKFKIKGNSVLAKKEDFAEFEEFREKLDELLWVSPVRWTPIGTYDYSISWLPFEDKFSPDVPHISDDVLKDWQTEYASIDFKYKEHIDDIKKICEEKQLKYVLGRFEIIIPVGLNSLYTAIEVSKEIDKLEGIATRCLTYDYWPSVKTYAFKIFINSEEELCWLDVPFEGDIDEFVAKCCERDDFKTNCDKKHHIIYCDSNASSNLLGIAEYIQNFVYISTEDEDYIDPIESESDNGFSAIYYCYDYKNKLYSKLNIF
jgi:hypothetical protein